MQSLKDGLLTAWPFALLGAAYTALLVINGDWRFSHGLLAGLCVLGGCVLGAATVRAGCEDEIRAACDRATAAELERWEALKSGLRRERSV